MKGLIRFIQAVLTVIWLGLLALSLALFVSAGGDGLPGISDWRLFSVTDTSMSPELSPGDMALIHMGGDPKAGDAVLCGGSAGSPELTRIIGSSEGQLILKPDGLEDSRLAQPEEIEGVYAGCLSGFGGAFGFLSSLTGAAVIFIAGLILVVLPGFMLRAPKPRTVRRPERAPEPGPQQRIPERPPERRIEPWPRPERSPRPSPDRGRPRPPRKGGYTPRH